MKEDLPFIAVYIFDTEFYKKQQFGFRKIGKFRAKFLLESVLSLKKDITRKNIPFLIKIGKTADIFRDMSEHYDIQKIFCQEEWTQEEADVENQIKNVLPSVIGLKSYSQLLLEPDFVFGKLDKIPLLFTAFRQKIEESLTIRNEFDCEKFSYNKPDMNLKIISDKISLKVLGFEDFETHGLTAFPFSGGETKALNRLNSYLFETKKLSRYKETRNGLIGTEYSSKLSAWLANGCLSAVTVYHQIKKYEDQFGSNDSSYWLVFELLWRDFFRYVSMEHQNKIFQQNGILEKEYSCNHQNSVEKWVEGKTDSDFINANMAEIKYTGWMSNRGRQNVASYFCKILKQDWRIGAAYFEEMLIDYDVHSNYGNWMYLAGVGNDPRSRTFNAGKQAEQYDNKQEFRKLWLNNFI